VGMAYLDAHRYQQSQRVNLEKQRLAPPSAPRFLSEGDMLGELQVPRLQLDTIVVQGDSNATLKKAVGHLPDSALPGQWGNVALAGHRDTFFRSLKDIKVGDEIRLKTPERNFEYRVESIKIVGPRDVVVLKSLTGHNLTLLTCFPIYYVGPAPKRLVVRAREIETPQQRVVDQNAAKSGNSQQLSF